MTLTVIHATFSMSSPALCRLCTNFSLHCANCAFLRSDLLFSSTGSSSFPFPRRLLRDRTSHTSTKSGPIKKVAGGEVGELASVGTTRGCTCCLPTNLGSSVSKVISHLWNRLVTSLIAVHIAEVVIICIVTTSCG